MQEKNEKLVTELAQMEKRVVTAETTLEATLQYESGQNKALSSPRYITTQLFIFFYFLWLLLFVEIFQIPILKSLLFKKINHFLLYCIGLLGLKFLHRRLLKRRQASFHLVLAGATGTR